VDAAVTPLKQHRERLGLRPEEAAARAEMSLRTLERWERQGVPTKPNHGKRADRLAKLAEIYGVDVESLVGAAA